MTCSDNAFISRWCRRILSYTNTCWCFHSHFFCLWPEPLVSCKACHSY